MKSDKHEEVADILGLLAASFEPPSIQQLAAWTKQQPAVVRSTLKKCLGSLFIISPHDRVNGFHKSIYDCLCDSKTPEKYRVNVAPAHQKIGKASVGTMSDPVCDRRVPCFSHLDLLCPGFCTLITSIFLAVPTAPTPCATLWHTFALRTTQSC